MDAATIALVVLPLLLVQLGLMAYALYDLFQEDRRVRGDSKAMWACIIVFVNGFGPLLYLFLGRDESRGVALERTAEDATAAGAPGASTSILASWPRLAASTEAAVTISGLTKRYRGGI